MTNMNHEQLQQSARDHLLLHFTRHHAAYESGHELLVLEAGLIARPDDRGDSVPQIAPPLISDRAVLDEIVDRMHDVLVDAGQYMDVGQTAGVA